jgi:hypothetical protein
MNKRAPRRSIGRLATLLAPAILTVFSPTTALAGTRAESNAPLQHVSKSVQWSNSPLQISNFGTRRIYINNKLVSSPYAFTANNTTYMPIWYVMQMLNSLNIQSSWDGNVWNLSVPANVIPDLSNLDGSGGKKAIDVNGSPVEHVDDIAYPDPSSHVKTSYMPIWYLQQALQRIGVHYTWDGVNWRMSYTAPSSGTADNYNVKPLHLDQDYQSIAETSGFQHGTQYMPLDDLVKALKQVGVNNYVNGNDWYLNASPDPNVSLQPFDPKHPIVLHENNQSVSTNALISYSGQKYYPIWYLMQALQSIQVFTLWDGTALHFSQSNIFHLHDVVNPHQTYTYGQMTTDIAALAQLYPDLIHYKVMGQTVYGRDIYAVSIGTGKATAFINGSHHAREWMTSSLNMYMIDQYAQAYERNQSLDGFNVRNTLNHTTLWFIPMVNPDGVTLEQYGTAAFPESARAGLVSMNGGSTNFSRWKANAQGIDPNRQYDGEWSGISIDPVTHPWYEDYKGTTPYSIPEVQAVVHLINQINPQMTVAYHASGQTIYWEYKVSGALYNTFKQYADTLHNMTGYSLVYPSPNPSGGGLTDWWTHDIGRPGFTIEVAPPQGENPVPLSYFDSVWNHNQGVGLYVAQQSYTLYEQHPSEVLSLP